MRKSEPQLSWADLDPAVLLSVADYLEGDGHGIYDANFLLNLGVPEEYVNEVTHIHTSGKSHKEAIYAPGTAGIPGISPILPSVVGVYSLDVYRRIGRDLGLPNPNKFGRGSEARDWWREIKEKLAS